jgi:hypothetical protein
MDARKGQVTHRPQHPIKGHCPDVLLKAAALYSILPVHTYPQPSQGASMPGKNGAPTRRSSRVTLRVPLKLYEPDTNRRFLVEQAYAVKVSLWGGLLALKAPVNRNQQLVAVNQATGQTSDSRIVYVGPMVSGGNLARLVAIEFLRPSPGFWGVVFPEPDPGRPQTRNYAR